GEVRGEEAYTLFQAMATGHLGMSTIHAESVDSVLRRMESEPMNIPRSLLATIDVIMVQIRTEINGKPARRAFTIAEMIGLDHITKDFKINQVFQWNARNDSFAYSGYSHILERNMKKFGMEESEVRKEILRRKAVLEWMAKNNIRRYDEVANIIREFYADPARVYRKARVGKT
ncbi:MAG TPA: ATPase, T2SS/T4P/T4SS family, partial [Candidatus Bathyarchaeia archaeon]|nr:ATPase, T2SS/T4P/T4SS family [Candidatus Bathyarchaeia archaeon]